MRANATPLTSTFNRFLDSEKMGGALLVGCTLVALAVANSSLGSGFHHLLERNLGGLSLERWINDGLMAVFFLLIGLELERELYSGELSDPRRALLPAIAAVGGMAMPAAIHLALNADGPTQAGAGIPMATDIAFALGALALLGSRVPPALKVFVVAFAVMDDLGAVVVIAAFYTAELAIPYLVGALAVLGVLLVLNRYLRVMALLPYLVGGVLMWWLLLRSGVHATLAGVALAFAIPFSSKDADAASPSHRLEHRLHRPVAFLILPLFALANTGVLLEPGWMALLGEPNSLGIFLGLTVGKPVGVTGLAYLAVRSGACHLPTNVDWRQMFGAGMLGGIGFTMSIFITNLAFGGEPTVTNASKLAILIASLTAGVGGYLWLRAIAPSVHRSASPSEAP